MNPKDATHSRTRADNCRGATLISLIAVMLVLGVMGVSIVGLTHTSEHSHLSANAGSRAYYLAESGLRYAQEAFCGEGWLHGRERTLTLQGGEQVRIVRIAGNFWATAVVDAGTAQEARASVPTPLSLCGVDPATAPADEFAVFGEVGIALGTRTLIEGDVAITDDDVDIRGDVDGSVLAQDVKLTGHGTVTGDIYSSGYVEVTKGEVLGDIHSVTGISVTSAESTVEGWLFSEGDIDVGGGATVLGEIHSCAGDVRVGGNGTSTSGIHASGNVYLSGTAAVNGDVHAGGSIYMSGSARIDGDAHAKIAIERTSDNTITGFQYAPTNPEEPICPDLVNLEDLTLPDATEFTAGGPNVAVPPGSEYYLSPGSYGTLVLPDNLEAITRLYLRSEPDRDANYYFTSVTFGLETMLFLDLSSGYDIRIFVEGDVVIASSMNVFVSTDGLTYHPMTGDLASPDPLIAAQVYWESHGNYTLEANSKWFGSVYTPYGNLRVGNTSYLIGSYYSGGGHNIIGSTVVHVAPNYFKEVP